MIIETVGQNLSMNTPRALISVLQSQNMSILTGFQEWIQVLHDNVIEGKIMPLLSTLRMQIVDDEKLEHLNQDEIFLQYARFLLVKAAAMGQDLKAVIEPPSREVYELWQMHSNNTDYESVCMKLCNQILAKGVYKGPFRPETTLTIFHFLFGFKSKDMDAKKIVGVKGKEKRKRSSSKGPKRGK